jgi:hypothetical protein
VLDIRKDYGLDKIEILPFHPLADIFPLMEGEEFDELVGDIQRRVVWLARRLNAARWLAATPLARVYLLTPRPSMPPGHVIAAGEKPGGGTQDFVWLVWDHDYAGAPTLHWLHRDRKDNL